MENTFGVPSVTRSINQPYQPYSFHKGTMSKTRKGRKNFTTKKGSKVFHRKGKYVRKSYKPYSRRRKH